MAHLAVRSAALIAVFGSLTFGGCVDNDSTTAPSAERFTATLNGANEVPAVSTSATGTANFTAVGDTAIAYTVSVNGLTGMTMGHIHAGAAGANGGVLVWLAPPNGSTPAAPSGTQNGVISSGQFNASWIRSVGGAAPISLDSLKRLMRSGNAYVNYHTATFAGGELRGQVLRTN